MKIILAITLSLLSIGLAKAKDEEQPRDHQEAEERANDLTRADLAFFFERISFENGEWILKFSPEVRGMLWRVLSSNSDLTGACSSGQILKFGPGSSLEVKRDDLTIFFSPSGLTQFLVRLNLKSNPRVSDPGGTREGYLSGKNGGYNLAYGRES